MLNNRNIPYNSKIALPYYSVSGLYRFMLIYPYNKDNFLYR